MRLMQRHRVLKPWHLQGRTKKIIRGLDSPVGVPPKLMVHLWGTCSSVSHHAHPQALSESLHAMQGTLQWL